jgi:hypothetical protein
MRGLENLIVVLPRCGSHHCIRWQNSVATAVDNKNIERFANKLGLLFARHVGDFLVPGRVPDFYEFAGSAAHGRLVSIILIRPPEVLDLNIKRLIKPFDSKVRAVAHGDVSAVIKKHQGDAGLREMIVDLSVIRGVL